MNIVTEVDRIELDFLTNEPVEGELLADRLARGPLPPDEALRYAIEIGSELNRAHGLHRVHGYLSPFTIALSTSGARILQPANQYDIRYAAYRSPEQVRHEDPTSVSDVFAYGALLYEMVTGKPAFTGAGVELDEKILEKPPASLNGKSSIHMAMEGVIAGCLAKDPAIRRQRVQNAVIELKLVARRSQVTPLVSRSPAGIESPEGLPSLKPGTRPVRAPQYGEGQSGTSWAPMWMVAALLVVVAGGLLAFWYLRQHHENSVYAFPVLSPEHAIYPGPPSVSPDGRYLAFSAEGPAGKRILWLRPFDSERPSPVAGTEGATEPFWSPDSRNIGFFTEGSLKKVTLEGSVPETICRVETTPGGAAWSADGTILFAPSLNGGLYRVSANGGAPEIVLRPAPAKSELSFLWPQFLPDKKHFLFFVMTENTESTGVYAGTVGSSEYRRLFSSETNAVYSAIAGNESKKRGYVLFMRDRTLMGQAFNVSDLALEGDAMTLREDVGAMQSMSLAPISVSNNAVLVYQTVATPTRQMVWLHRSGKQIAIEKQSGQWGPPRISPDGSRAIAPRLGPDGHNADLWLLDPSGNSTQVTDTPVHEGSPVWSPDGSRLAFFVFGKTEGNYDIYTRPVRDGKTDLMFKNDSPKYPTDWSHDGRYIFFNLMPLGAKGDVWAVSTVDHHAGPILETLYTEGYASLSPDGKWLAFQSDESGKTEVYVQPFDGISSGTKRRWQVSNGSGGYPRWRGDGKELFFLTNTGRMMSAALHPVDNTFAFDPPQVLFQTRSFPRTWNLYDVSPDGQSFLVNLPLELPGSSSLSVVTNWTEKLKN